MRKFIVFISSLLLISLLVLTFIYGSNESFSTIITLFVLGILILSYFYFEKSKMGTKEIALIATLSAFSAAMRVVFAPLPNIKPTTFLVAISGLVFGPYEGFLVGSTSAFLSNIFLGHGPWTPWQMLSWGIVGIISGFLGRRSENMSTEKFSIICFLYGFLFDWIMNLWHVIGYIRPITIKSILLAYLTGLTFDVMHAGGNFVFAMIFYKNFYKVLKRFKRRMEISYFKQEGKL